MSFAPVLDFPPLLAAEPTAPLRVGDHAPDFELQFGPHRTRLYRWIDDAWAVLFTAPESGTLDGAAELRRLARFLPDFRSRYVKLLGIARRQSVDAGDEPLPFAVTSDDDGTVARRYGLAGAGSRGVVVIDPDSRIRLLLGYPATRDRDFGDVLRLVTALQQADARERAVRSDWRTHQIATLGAW